MSRQFAFVTAIAVSAMSIAASGSVIFNWRNNSANTLKDQFNNNIAQSNATVLTYLSGDAIIDYPMNGILQPTYGSGAGQDTFLGAWPNSTGGRYNTPFFNFSTDVHTGKYVYAIVLNLPFSTFVGLSGDPMPPWATYYSGTAALNTVPVGTYYAITTMGSTNVGGAPTPLRVFDALDPTSQMQFFGGALQTTLTTIPEPNVAVLGGLGGLAAWWGRRLRRKLSSQGE